MANIKWREKDIANLKSKLIDIIVNASELLKRTLNLKNFYRLRLTQK